MNVAQNYQIIKNKIYEIARRCGRDPATVIGIAVTKGHSIEEIEQLYEAGCRLMGESRIQEALPKIEHFPNDLQWHFIGTLQKNKVKQAVGCFDLIHSVDTPELAQKISQCSKEANKKTKVLLQVNTSGEPSKHGLDGESWACYLSEMVQLPFLQIQGLMTMAPLTEDEQVIRICFSRLRQLRDEWMSIYADRFTLDHLSMGMSHDYPIAIEEGATLLRIGSAIFEG